MKQVRRWSFALAGVVALALVVGVSCGRSTSPSTSTDDEMRRSALVGDPIQSVQQVEGVAPVSITNATSGADGGTIDSTSFTIGLFDEDVGTPLCPTLMTGVCLTSPTTALECEGGPCCPLCGISAHLNPAHLTTPPFPPFDDVSVVEVAVNVGDTKAMHWDWHFGAYHNAPFGEFSAQVVDQNGQTTPVIAKTTAPDAYGFQTNPFQPVRPPFVTATQHLDLDLSPWAEQKIRLRFILHTNYNPHVFDQTGCGFCTGFWDVGTAKAYVDNLHVDTCAVTSIELLDVVSPILDNPGGGKRIFPDKSPPGTVPDADSVRVVVHTNRPSCPVTLRSFDVDDPSSDSAIDTNGPAGDDNLGKANGNKCGAFLPGGACQMDTTSGADGTAVVGFVVSKQPGDNFVIVAGSDKDQVSKVKMVISGNTSVLQDGDDNAVPNTHVAASPTLTVWRHLHMQVDSMGAVAGNHFAGTITRAAGLDSSGTPLVSVVRLSIRMTPSRFAGGRVVFNGTSFSVLGNDTGALLLDDPTGLVSQRDTGASFVLYDDDNLAGNNQALINGDEGFDVPGPDMGLLQDADDPAANVLAPAYIRPTYDVPGGSGQPFALNVAEGDLPFADQMAAVTADYWFLYMLGGYQGPENGCWDPPSNSSQQVLGKSQAGEGGIIYSETIRDFLQYSRDQGTPTVESNATTVAHEVGHLLGAGHGQGGLMGNDGRGAAITEPVFKPKSIRAIRRRVSP